jgi:DNA topoisomerase VI subunit A
MELNREHFEISRAAEYFDAKELQAQTGQPAHKFGEVVLKELIDNALDACESAGINPVIQIGIATNEERVRICVSDNGKGISEAVIKNILNFDTRTSDKAAYKAPTRGAQGNAFKTIIGIPHALGGGLVTIESQGLRHTIKAKATPAGTIDIDHKITQIDARTGTAVYVDMPKRAVYPYWYARATAIFNPHAIVKIRTFEDIEFTMLTFDDESEETATFYNSLSECQKIRPNEPTSAHWYDSGDYEKLVYLQGDQNDIELGKFVRQFRGLSSTGKAKVITSQLKDYRLVSDIYRDPIAIESMRLAMQNESKPVLPKALGAIGVNNLLSRLDVDRHWYKQVSGLIDNIPYVFEILIADSEGAQGFYFGVNHSVTFGDFLRQSRIKAGELNGTGIEGALADIVDTDEHIVVVHLIGIGLPFLDRGKSNLSLPPEMIENISGAVWLAAKSLHKERKKEDKDAAKAEREEKARENASKNKTFIKTAVFAVLAAAIQAATDMGRLPANVRNLFYKVRDAIQKYTPKELNYTYFSQDILIKYWQEFGRDKLIYNDPRGVLYEPHSEKEVQLGTFSVDKYIFPDHQFNKILYIEKKGLWHTIKAGGLHKKYDMAVIGGEGYASEAIRILLEKAQVGQDYTIFVLHDADPDGYNIARTIQESTKRMPDHNIDVIDLGLTVQDAINMGIPSETFTRKKALVKELELNEIEHEYFDGELKYGKKRSYICNRIELNAMSAGQLVDYIDSGISRAIDEQNLTKKVIPDESVLHEEAEAMFKNDLEVRMDCFIREQLNVDELKIELLKIFSGDAGVFDEQEFKSDVSEYLADNELKTWGNSVQVIVDEKLEALNADVEISIKELVETAIKAA